MSAITDVRTVGTSLASFRSSAPTTTTSCKWFEAGAENVIVWLPDEHYPLHVCSGTVDAVRAILAFDEVRDGALRRGRTVAPSLPLVETSRQMHDYLRLAGGAAAYCVEVVWDTPDTYIFFGMLETMRFHAEFIAAYPPRKDDED
jgi:hypothetical protein